MLTEQLTKLVVTKLVRTTHHSMPKVKKKFKVKFKERKVTIYTSVKCSQINLPAKTADLDTLHVSIQKEGR